MKNRGAKSPGGQLYDRLLVPRIEQYALNNDYTDVDELTDYLRRSYKEYQRQKLGPFKNQVARAVEAVTRRGGPAKPEIRLQALEDRHLEKGRRAGGSGGSESGTTSGSDSSGSEASDGEDEEGASSGAELDGEVAAALTNKKAPSSMNRSLLYLYGGKAPESGDGAAEDGEERPAFAPPHVIAAAAERAAREAAAAKSAAGAGSRGAAGAAPSTSQQRVQQQQQDQQGSDILLPDAGPEGPTASQRAMPASSSGRAAPAAAGGAAEGPATSTKAGIKGKRGGATPAERATASKRARTAGGGRGGGGATSSTIAAPKPVTYADLGGIEGVLGDIKELIEYPLKHPEVYGWLGVEPPRGVLLHGPPGCGKTALANAIANECGVPFLKVSAPEVVSGMSGESEAKIRQLFTEAAAAAPCIVFIDEIDAIAPKRETAQREMERRIVAQMLTCLDDLSGLGGSAAGSGGGEEGQGEQAGGEQEDGSRQLLSGKHVVVIGATNRPDSLDAALRRAGRFDREIAMGIPSEEARCKILQVLARRLRLAGDFEFAIVAKRTPGYVGADLAALCKEAAALAVKRIFSQLEAAHQAQQAQQAQQEQQQQGGQEAGGDDTCAAAAAAATAAATTAAAARGSAAALAELSLAPGEGKQTTAAATGRLGQGPLTAAELGGLAITMADFEGAIAKVQPSVRREGFATTPDVTWEDVGSLNEVREELSFAITQPIAHPALFESMGLQAGTGVLLFGPPGCGKTLVAKAVASESGANFISIKGPELLNKYVGESERAVRQLFTRARAAAPCVLFFDEMDALAPRRGSDVNQSSERVVNQLLTEMDGVDGREGVYLVAATNRPDMIDPALLRPGRLDKILYVPLPPPEGRASILQALTRKTPLGGDVDLAAVGASPRLTGFSGADLAALVREACVCALKESMAAAMSAGGAAATAGTPQVTARHFELAMQRVQPSVSRKDQRMYDALRTKLRSTRGHLQQEGQQPSEAPADLGAAGTADGAADMEGTAENNEAAGGAENEPMEEEPGT